MFECKERIYIYQSKRGECMDSPSLMLVLKLVNNIIVIFFNISPMLQLSNMLTSLPLFLITVNLLKLLFFFNFFPLSLQPHFLHTSFRNVLSFRYIRPIWFWVKTPTSRPFLANKTLDITSLTLAEAAPSASGPFGCLIVCVESLLKEFKFGMSQFVEILLIEQLLMILVCLLKT